MRQRRTPLSLIEIDEDLQIEIFLKLPVKSLLLYYVIVKVGSPGFDIEVYKMSTDSWTTIQCNLFDGAPFIPTVYRVQSPVFLNGSFHWAVKNSQPNSANDSTSNYIVYYKVKDEEVGLMNVFDDDSAILDVVVDEWRFSTRYKLSVIDEKLAMIFWNGEQGNIFEIWMMNDYGIGNNWSRRFQISETFSDYIFPLENPIYGKDWVFKWFFKFCGNSGSSEILASGG
ncbi:hypothetical protein POM88_034352 [Heracleum sosnowskyi]|uniref:F-box associated beta-propeller type 1 domain-containing protein n=1 Tax=Heracleum sosnowskyi TaxID=360622 RepID=A0AAD8HLG2_9APIA|nr:hypothetical protein POM88_034352 [Heracleum sosnowskyi]